MNVFYCHHLPHRAAEALEDRHVIKMCLETAQILSTVARQVLPEADVPVGLYRSTHKNHPVVVAVRRGAEEIRDGIGEGLYARWVADHGLALSVEYSARFNKVHASACVIRAAKTALGLGPALPVPFDEVPQAVPDALASDDPVEAYRATLRAKYAAWHADAKKRPLKWTGCEPPSWLS